MTMALPTINSTKNFNETAIKLARWKTCFALQMGLCMNWRAKATVRVKAVFRNSGSYLEWPKDYFNR